MDSLLHIELLPPAFLVFMLGYFCPFFKKEKEKSTSWSDEKVKEAVRYSYAVGSQDTADRLTELCKEEGINLEEILGSAPISTKSNVSKTKLH